ncbi:hypothetical protein [Paraburkholderia humisilvae]|uniref:Uncharacterized protein n=1 Tax=Paraburkholderia humisilvae TaxID=627669 RepID=A0A6J5F4A0_9BURK|nr:hypothetical protein [Paraburkholderia humisilvae]CAB3773608.1 hypothetical protein LMG29542_07342 [Paraburkholderia humisilvae]
MFEAISVETFNTLDQINAIAAVNPDDPRVAAAISQLRDTAHAVLAAAAATPDSYARSTAKAVHDGLVSAAAICERMRQT